MTNILPQSIRQRLDWALNIVLLVIFCWLLAQWTWLAFLPNARQPMLSSTPLSPTQAADSIRQRHLFGVAASAAVAMPEAVSVSSSLKLLGVFSAIGTLPAFAIISVDGKPGQPVQAGREVQPGVMLDEVYPGSVRISRVGVAQQLNLEKRNGSPVSLQGEPSFKLDVQARGGNSFTFSRGELDRALQDSKQLVNLGRLSPYPGGGMLVDGAPPGSLAEKLGLQVGDVVQRFNQQPVRTGEDVPRFMQQLRHLQVAQLDILRAGRPLQLKYEIRQ